jgi:DedD protein
VSDADNLEIKKRARRRLVGAIALALVAAIVLPMMMEQRPQTAAPDIQVSIPERDADGALSRPIAARDAEPAVVDAEPEIVPAPVEQPPAAGAVPEPEPPPLPPAAVAPKPEPAPKADPKPAARPEPKPKPAAVAKSADEAEAARVRAILRGETPPPLASATPSSASFLLQIGAFSDGARAASIAAALKKAGIGAYTEKAGSVTRVRIGPFASRDAAEREAMRVREQGHAPVVVTR